MNMNKTAIMQPYFMPYIGYFQLIQAADLFVVYDNIQYTKKGWINRNRFLRNGGDATFSIPLSKASDYLDVRDRTVAGEFDPGALMNVIAGAYRKAPYFKETSKLLEEILHFEDLNLFRFILHSLEKTCRHLGIPTAFLISSEIGIDHALRGQDKVLAICEATRADQYLNSIGGVALYSREAFLDRGIDLRFVKPGMVEYPQFGAPFVPWLSIIDVMMFNTVEQIGSFLRNGYELI